MPLPFYNPGWLAGAAGAAAPIIIHLLNKQRYRRMWWAAMEFLRRAIEKRRRRLRIEQLILLALRTLSLLLLAFVLSRPFLGGSVSDLIAQSNMLRVFVVDNSFSMAADVGGEAALERAKRAAVQLAGEMRGQDASMIILANDAPEVLFELPLSDRERVQERLAAIEVSDRGTDIPVALQAAFKAVNENDLPVNAVYVFTDLQQVGWQLNDAERRAALAAAAQALARRTRVTIVDVGSADPVNVAVTAVSVLDPIVATLQPAQIAVEVANFSDSAVIDLPVELFVDEVSAGSDVIDEIKPAGTARKTFHYTFQRPGYHALRVQTRADALRPDDQRFLAVRVRDGIKVLIVDGDFGAGGRDAESFHLVLALQPEAHAPLERRFLIEPRVVNDVAFEQEPLSDYDLVVLANVAQVSEERVTALHQYVTRGGALMVFMGDLTGAGDYNQAFRRKGQHLLPVTLTEPLGNPADQSVYVTLNITDSNHPVMGALLEYTKASLALIRIYRYFGATVDEADPQVRVLARVDDVLGTPVIVEYDVGKGKVCYVGTTADGAWHNLDQRVVFYAIFMHEMSRAVIQGSTAGRNLAVGERYVRTVTPAELQGAVLVTTPQGEVESLTPDEKAFQVHFAATARAGLYAVDLRGTDGVDGFAVNLDPVESNLARIDEDALREDLPKADNVTYEFRRADHEGSIRGGRRPESEIWKTLALILAACLCLESFLAWKFGRYR